MKEWLKDITIRKSYYLKLWLNKKQTYLWNSGWIKSYQEKRPVNLKGEAQPWLSLPFIKFLESRLNKDMTVFEYGSGNSSIYLSSKGLEIWSVEHNEAWYQKIKSFNLANHHIYYQALEESYIDFIYTLDRKYDLIIIDGRQRLDCIKPSVEHLSGNGVIVFDDLDRDRYQKAYNLFSGYGFKHIDFWGMALGSFRMKCTSIFYRQENILKI